MTRAGRRRRPASMARRVMWATTLSAAMGGLFAATIAILAVDALVRDHADQRLRAATDVLAGEIDELREEGEHESLDEVLDDENGEIVTSGIRLAVYEDGEVISGDPWAPLARSGECETFGRVGQRVRSCAAAYERWTLVAAQQSDAGALWSSFFAAGVAALLAGMVLAALLSRRITRWAVGPLERLSRQLDASSPDELGPIPGRREGECAEVQKIQDALDGLILQVATLLERSQRFASDAAHELRTPLTALSGELELLREDCTGETAARIGVAHRRARQLSDLVDRLLFLALPPDDLRRGFEPVALEELLTDVAEGLPAAEHARVQICAECEGLVSGDPLLLRSLITNALSNALKFSAPHDVQAVLRDERERIVIEISDRGPGVPAHLRARVFEPFYRRRADATPGHGLGLALIAHIVGVHHGEARFVDVESGAALVVSFPRWRDPSAATDVGSGRNPAEP